MSLTPFIRHELEHQPGTAAAPENSCTRCSPPLGREPDILLPGDPAAPGTQVPPQIETPGQTPHPDTNSLDRHRSVLCHVGHLRCNLLLFA